MGVFTYVYKKYIIRCVYNNYLNVNNPSIGLLGLRS